MRPREFDHDDVLRIAFDQFWRKGVRGTSLTDIARDAGDQRGSLYNAFGSKEALFLQAYERYADDYLLALQKALGAGSLRKRLTAFFDLTITNFRAGSPPRGCPTTRGLMELGAVEGEGLDEEARRAFAELVTRITSLVRDTLSAGAERGDFSGDPEAAALHIITVTRGLAVLERAFGDEAELRRIAAHTIDLILGKGSRST
ncbi:TetR/AcrR family transcriptional regulator [Bradyrhizobium sp. 186]|uniref:TetR/AcrR family transcriptional regulator n=1 Tax=Bradyrhizobium sp. 186 TaxID=2782654 RepID=UPI002001522C|nr:TetR/AcrR family transcriptional regulator [Bradyrhizobium sp. 186]UPK36789.1 TetR/AcrR family transcriptional regulator [Bradyrhizobium sp. 186]